MPPGNLENLSNHDHRLAFKRHAIDGHPLDLCIDASLSERGPKSGNYLLRFTGLRCQTQNCGVHLRVIALAQLRQKLVPQSVARPSNVLISCISAKVLTNRSQIIENLVPLQL